MKIPVIANGCSTIIKDRDDALKFRDDCRATSLMIARAALVNMSIFRPEGMLPNEEVISEYLKMCIDYDNAVANVKYCVQLMYRPIMKIRKAKFGRTFDEANCLEQVW